MAGDWDPRQYARFATERAQPFYDLAALVERDAAMRVIDLGCGGGELTAWLHGELGARETTGVDRSDAMLEQSAERVAEGLRFVRGEIERWSPAQPADLVFSNAALQWVEGHEQIWPRLVSMLAAGGQLAVQMPMNDDHPSHAVARAVAAEPPFRAALEGYARRFPTLTPERYMALLHELGFERRHVRLQIYDHVLPDPGAVVEWVKGSLLTAYRQRLDAETYERFLDVYRARLAAELGDRRPYLYTYRRILMWGRLPA